MRGAECPAYLDDQKTGEVRWSTDSHAGVELGDRQGNESKLDSRLEVAIEDRNASKLDRRPEVELRDTQKVAGQGTVAKCSAEIDTGDGRANDRPLVRILLIDRKYEPPENRANPVDV